MPYQETGRFGRITKNLRKLGFEKEMASIVSDSLDFPKLTKNEQTEYIEKVIVRMQKTIGLENTKRVMFKCGAQCCGKSWSQFAQTIFERSANLEDFFANLNKEEKQYNTKISYNEKDNTITVTRSKCICGLINKGSYFKENKGFCACSIGHMDKFFSTLFDLKNIELKGSIYSGNDKCEWLIELK